MEISDYRSINAAKVTTYINLVKNHEKKTAFIIAMIFMVLAQAYINAQKFEGDAAGYWYFSSYIWNFSFPHTLRGYFYPFLLSPSKLIFEAIPESGYLAFYAIQAITFSYILTIMLPDVFTRLIGGRVTLTRRVLPPVFITMFFPGLVAYPLSDLTALCLIIASISLALSASEQTNVARALLLALLSGVLAYGAYNTRTIYLFMIILLPVLMPVLILKGRTIAARTIITFSFVVGAAIAATPQSLINQKYLDSPSPLVVANINNVSLFAYQLKWGITVQRYETGYDAEAGVIFPVYYTDPVGERIFKDHDVGSANPTVSWYFRLLFSEPLSFLRIYTKHFINGFDVRDGDPYTRVRSKENNITSFASISVAILGLFVLLMLIFRESVAVTNNSRFKVVLPRLVWTVVLLIPVVAIVPGAIETRFFLPLHLIAYCSIAFGLSINSLKLMPCRKLALLATIYFSIVVLCYISAKESISNPVYEVPKEYIQ